MTSTKYASVESTRVSGWASSNPGWAGSKATEINYYYLQYLFDSALMCLFVWLQMKSIQNTIILMGTNSLWKSNNTVISVNELDVSYVAA